MTKVILLLSKNDEINATCRTDKDLWISASRRAVGNICFYEYRSKRAVFCSHIANNKVDQWNRDDSVQFYGLPVPPITVN
jgi:hypothetical protein